MSRLRRLRSGARNLLLILILDYLVLSVATAWAEGWSVFEGFYYGMTCITTVGFGDFVPQTWMGRSLAMVLIPVGIVLGFGAGFLLVQDAVRVILSRSYLSMVSPNLKGHTIVCGYGKIGRVVVQTLLNLKKQVCVVERDSGLVSRMTAGGTDFDYVIGDAMDVAILRQAGIETADCIVTTFDDDADNVYVILEVRELSAAISIIATASTPDAVRRLRLAGAHRVISPAAIAGEMLAKSAVNPDALDLMTDVTDATANEATFGQVAVQPGSWLAGQTLAEVGSKAPGALVVMVKDGTRVAMAPGGAMEVRPGMILVVVGKAEAVKALTSLDAP